MKTNPDIPYRARPLFDAKQIRVVSYSEQQPFALRTSSLLRESVTQKGDMDNV